MKNFDMMVTKNNLLIIGASGHGKVIADIAIKMNKWQYIAFLDDDKNIQSTMGIEVIGKSNEVAEYINDFDLFVAVGNNKIRQNLLGQLQTLNANIAKLIHPCAIIGNEVDIGIGTAVMAGAVINSCSRIGNGCIINTGATIDHDNIIEDYVHVSPGAHLGGTVHVGSGTWIGIGGVVCNNVNIVGGCVVGAGAVVTKDITLAGTYIGVPAKKILLNNKYS